ncbi:hydroxymethylpyrimidine/phosphomethylpyrimidine kinase [Nicoletella semolina]|uniref:hydroxymethylpyrimidine kinase n=1 Tax=Nicoletella semolina TaxID=271160 RepID=A0A4R2N9M7_9PAST|nr:bifunctional hydroxymethylpyrimidine kinase/phosphomethylpyrimidine kinase [Nicoletella semolina]MDH2923789.1 hydroxymethylpyrimidine/phosphomethylpyrimidine kinase [Nicoletella semolina]TCP17625.1 hydroxymethylpyrimidine/phosphomethylpyrimidine kinase [Nicoletella semolina]
MPNLSQPSQISQFCNTPQALTIAGSDSGGGAGIQADLKTFQMRKVFGTSVITAVTAQNSLGVFDIHAVPLKTVEAQLKAIADDFQISAFKIGMLGNAETIIGVASMLKKLDFRQLVLDPVMVAKGGAALLESEAIYALREYLLPLAMVITPNLPEAKALTGVEIIDDQTASLAAHILQEQGVKNVVIKGGHLAHSQSAVCRDWVFTPEAQFVLDSPRYSTRHTHGTGCTFSACLTAELAKGKAVSSAVKIAKDFITQAIAQPLNIGQGHGPTNHWAYQEEI